MRNKRCYGLNQLSGLDRLMRRVAPQPPANVWEPSGFGEGGCIFIPDGMAAISRGLSGATPPERGNGEHDPGRGRSVGV